MAQVHTRSTLSGWRKPARERPHRLPREFYRGEVTVSLTACVAHGQLLFRDAEVVNPFVHLLRGAVEKRSCVALIYCFMPDHLHLILRGKSLSADTWKAMVDFKQQSGFWLWQHLHTFHWQKDLYDHIIRTIEELRAQVCYIANNPVRKGLAQSWDEYPFTGAIGVNLKEVIEGAIALLPHPLWVRIMGIAHLFDFFDLRVRGIKKSQA